eukprot:Gb_31095 [translate_table: standard]
MRSCGAQPRIINPFFSILSSKPSGRCTSLSPTDMSGLIWGATLRDQMNGCWLPSRPLANAWLCSSERKVWLPNETYRTERGRWESSHCSNRSLLTSANFPRFITLLSSPLNILGGSSGPIDQTGLAVTFFKCWRYKGSSSSNVLTSIPELSFILCNCRVEKLLADLEKSCSKKLGGISFLCNLSGDGRLLNTTLSPSVCNVLSSIEPPTECIRDVPKAPHVLNITLGTPYFAADSTVHPINTSLIIQIGGPQVSSLFSSMSCCSNQPLKGSANFCAKASKRPRD